MLGPGADAEGLPLFLKQHQWLDLRKGDVSAQELKQLLQSVTGLAAENISLLGPNQSPFRGLFAFAEEYALLFFGGDEETDQLVKKLSLDRVLAVVGDSGSGKSSLVKAGLTPALHGGRLALATGEAATRKVCVARPKDPVRELAEGVAQLDSGLSPAESTAFVAEAKRQMATGTEGLRNAIAGLRIPRATRVLVVIDQFEDPITISAGPPVTIGGGFTLTGEFQPDSKTVEFFSLVTTRNAARASARTSTPALVLMWGGRIRRYCKNLRVAWRQG